MAIRPVDLQLAYLAAPQNAAVASHAQNAAQTAQQAAQAAFAAEVRLREEAIAEGTAIEGAVVRARDDEPREGHPDEGERREPRGEGESAPLGFAGDGDHFIDVTA